MTRTSLPLLDVRSLHLGGCFDDGVVGERYLTCCSVKSPRSVYLWVRSAEHGGHVCKWLIGSSAKALSGQDSIYVGFWVHSLLYIIQELL